MPITMSCIDVICMSVTKKSLSDALIPKNCMCVDALDPLVSKTMFFGMPGAMTNLKYA